MPEGEDMTQEVPFSQGPYLAAAFLCETVLQENDGRHSIIRIIDRINRQAIGTAPPEEMEPFDYSLDLYLSFKAGSARGPMMLRVRLEKPNGESGEVFARELYFEGDDERGINHTAHLRLGIGIAGLHWFDVYLADQRMTRIPLRVAYSREIRPPTKQV